MSERICSLAVCALMVVLPAGAAGQPAAAPSAAAATAAPPGAAGSAAPQGTEHALPASPAQAARNPAVLVGPVTREQVEAAVPLWVQAGVDAKPDLQAARGLAAVPPGAEVTVLLGTWCGDSRREVSRFWRALDEIGASPAGGAAGGLPFTVTYIGVDEAKKEPAAEVAAADLRYVPIFIVRRGGREVGRIVEKSPQGIEADLLALLDGKATGLLTASARAKPN